MAARGRGGGVGGEAMGSCSLKETEFQFYKMKSILEIVMWMDLTPLNRNLKTIKVVNFVFYVLHYNFLKTPANE